MTIIIWVYVFIAGSLIEAREFKDEDLCSFPPLFHLDDYERCLSQRNGLYCLATFRLTPLEEPHHTYNLIKEYTSNRYYYNRSLIHRGYCVSARCPNSSNYKNVSTRLQQCADELARSHRLKATLHTFRYCHRHRNVDSSPDIPQYVFLYIVCGILCLNIIGTAHDVLGGKNTRLLSWSIISNWRQLTSTNDNEKDPRQVCYRPGAGSKPVLTLIVLCAHAAILHLMVFMHNPRDVELSTSEVSWQLITNGTIIVQMFVVISMVLCVQNLLLDGENKQLTYSMIPKKIIKRFIRIAPVHLLVVGFCATWWIEIGDGPLWWSIVGYQRDVCRRKFWTHLLSINNIVNIDESCQIQTWFMAVNIQIYVLSLFLTILLAPLRRRAIPILVGMFVFSCISLSVLSYIFGWQPILTYATPEAFQKHMYGGLSEALLYISPLGSLPSCIIGSLIAHLQYEIQEAKVKLEDWKWLAYSHNLFIPACIIFVSLGKYIKDTSNEFFQAAYIGVEKFVFGIMCAVQIIGVINIDSWFKDFYSWRGWKLLNNVTLAVIMTHWCINITLVATRPQPNTISSIDIIVDVAATCFLTYLIALPVTILVESPMRRFLDTFIK